MTVLFCGNVLSTENRGVSFLVWDLCARQHLTSALPWQMRESYVLLRAQQSESVPTRENTPLFELINPLKNI